MVPTDGSTIDVLIGDVPVGHPTYGFARAEHTIAWIVRDSGNRNQGIGSRFFTVVNP